jgi:hypothetical protein
MLLGNLDVSGATTLNGLTNNGTTTLNGATTINNTLSVTGMSTFNGIINNGTLTQNGVSTFNATVNVTGPNVTNIGGALNVTGLSTLNGGLNNNGTFNQNGNMTQTGGTVIINGATTINNTLTTTGNMNLGTASTNNTYGGPSSANRFNGTSNFGTLPASNGNKLIIDGVVSNSAVPPPSTIPGSDYEGVVNGDFQVTGYTNLNNAFINNLTVGSSIMFPPSATACLNTLQVQTLTSWCSGPAGASINLGTALSQSSLGTSGSNSFMATTVTGALTQSGGNANIAGGATNVFGNLGGTNAINGNTTINGNATVTGITDAQNSIVNTTGSDGGRVTVNDGLHVSGTASNTTLDGDANIFGLTGRGTTLVANPVAINPPTLNEATPNNTNSVRGHAQFIGTGAGLNERKIFVHGVPEGPGFVTPNNTIPPVTNFEVEIVGDLYVQGTIVGGGIPQIRSYDATLIAGAGPNGGGGVLIVAPAGGVDANDAVHVQYTNFGMCTGSLVATIVGANIQIESSCALDNANVKVTVIRYAP